MRGRHAVSIMGYLIELCVVVMCNMYQRSFFAMMECGGNGITSGFGASRRKGVLLQLDKF